MVKNTRQIDSELKFLFLGSSTLEKTICKLCNVHQTAHFVNDIEKAKIKLRTSSYDVLVVNELFLNKTFEILEFSKKSNPDIFNVAFKKTKNSLVDCSLALTQDTFTQLLLNTISFKTKIAKNHSDVMSLKNSFKYEMLGSSRSMQKLRELILKLGKAKSNIIISGESGTGKELISRMINKVNPAPFVAVNCGSISETLVESELFGHKKGSFTNAIENKVGFIEKANGGDLFLDEIGELPLSMQTKLLRVLQDGEFFRVGSSKKSKSNFRIIAGNKQKFRRTS